MVGVAGLEPATSRSQSAHSKPTELYPDKHLSQLYNKKLEF
jgi:hypothetical protein